MVNEQNQQERKNDNDEIKFSWKSVFKRWGQNLRDGLDPAITGAKMGAYGLHAIPKWHREYKEGRMRSESPGLSGILGLVVAGTMGAGYWFGSKFAVEQMDSPMGYGILGIPVLANGASWVGEAFYSAKKTEHKRVVMTRIQRTIENEAEGEYDLTTKDMLNALMVSEAELRSHRGNRGYASLEDFESDKAHFLYLKGHDVKQEDVDETAMKRVAEIEATATRYISDLASDMMDGIYADKALGKQFEMSVDLRVGPAKRNSEREIEHYRHSDLDGTLSKLIRETVKEKGGTANIEMFGQVTSVYGGEGNTAMSYQVKPNGIWKK